MAAPTRTTGLPSLEGFDPVKLADDHTYASRIASERLATFWVEYPGEYEGLNKELRVLVNPESYSTSVAPNYSRRAVLGLSHDVVQYIRTGSREIDLELWVSWQIFLQKQWISSSTNPLQYRNSFEALVMPTAPGLAPPRVYFHWPGAHLDFYGVVDSLSMEFESFSSRGDPLSYTINIGLLETPIGFMGSPAVHEHGIGVTAARPPSGGPPMGDFPVIKSKTQVA